MKLDELSIDYSVLSHDYIIPLCQDLLQELLFLFSTGKPSPDKQKSGRIRKSNQPRNK